MQFDKNKMDQLVTKISDFINEAEYIIGLKA
jgi:uncharacterized protein (DUF2164 family)